jgi:hypothetical protein
MCELARKTALRTSTSKRSKVPEVEKRVVREFEHRRPDRCFGSPFSNNGDLGKLSRFELEQTLGHGQLATDFKVEDDFAFISNETCRCSKRHHGVANRRFVRSGRWRAQAA